MFYFQKFEVKLKVVIKGELVQFAIRENMV